MSKALTAKLEKVGIGKRALAGALKLEKRKSSIYAGSGWNEKSCPVASAYGFGKVDVAERAWEALAPEEQKVLREDGWTPTMLQAFIEWHDVEETGDEGKGYPNRKAFLKALGLA